MGDICYWHRYTLQVILNINTCSISDTSLPTAGVSLLMFCCFNILKKFERAHEDRGVRYEEPRPERDHLLSSSGLSYDYMSQGDEDLDFTINRKCLGDDEASNNSRRLCAISFDAPRECFFLPCGHFCGLLCIWN
ncbi:unnamed protein product [Lupinus luteus]|uniref:Uncharacterized protein n=1 Tax=Lupinus luteus TaxID=3873 RepID=A0AAV1YM59_LUPLU